MRCPILSPKRCTTGRPVGSERAKSATTGTSSTGYGEAPNTVSCCCCCYRQLGLPSRSALFDKWRKFFCSHKIQLKFFLKFTEFELLDGGRSEHFEAVGQRTLAGGQHQDDEGRVETADVLQCQRIDRNGRDEQSQVADASA